MNFRLLLLLIVPVLSLSFASAQDTLPKFSAFSKGADRIIISWTNPYGNTVKQISIQRSFDSLKNYRTILTVVDPTVPQNGYVDTKATNDHMFYRIYIQRDSGKYTFSAAKRPGIDTGTSRTDFLNSAGNEPTRLTTVKEIKELKEEAKVKNERIIYIKNRDLLLGAITESSLKHFRDSLYLQTKDTVFMKTADTLVIKSFVAKEYYRPSRYVFTEKDGNIKILLADVSSKKYELKFFEEDNTEVFEIKHIKEPFVILDKTNFIHSGWFNFELYEDGKLKEKHKLYVPKDF